MYHCHINFYCFGRQRGMYEKMQEMSPLEPFTHSFSVTEGPEMEPAAKADTIFADVRGTDADAVLLQLAAAKKETAELILLAEQPQIAALAGKLGAVSDIWTLPMAEDELTFRFLRWQQAKKREMDAWETNQFLETTLHNTPNLIWFKDLSGVHEKVNDSFCRMVGKTQEQVQGRKHAYIWDAPENDPACAESDRGVIESGIPAVSEEHVHIGGSERVLTTCKAPIYGLDGNVMGTFGVAIDITQARDYEQELLAKNLALEQLFTTMDCGVLCHTVDGTHILSINRAALLILGYESQEEMEQDGFNSIASTVLTEDQPQLRQCIQMLHHANESISTEYRVRHKDGKVLHIIGNIKLVEENGEWFYQHFLIDCTAQKLRDQAKQNRMDEQIRYQEQLFNIFSTYLAYSTDDVYLMLDAACENVEYVSPNVERVLGIPPEEIENDLTRFGRASYAEGEEIDRPDLLNMQPGESLAPRETERVNQATNEHKWFRESVYCVSLQDDKKIIVYISDRTRERKTHDDLVQALSMAQVANKAKSTFLSSVSHDIRTPLNAIMGFVTLLREDAGDRDRVLEYTQRIDSASQHLLGLINDVLDMNKIESGGATLNLAEMNLADVIDEINAIIRPQARAKEQEFDILTSALTYEHLFGDRLRINQILINILSNAIKYTQKGGTITMRVTELPQVMQNYSRIQFVISDNGQGMSEAYQKVLFTPFTREQETTTNQIQGTGLGMSITKNLVELMDGTIRVDSKLGKGTTFTVELELRIQEQALDPKFWSNHRLSRMIVVDDDEDICNSIKRSMRETDVQVDYATNGYLGAEMIDRSNKEKQPYDLVLLDWKMPILSGLETARLIREQQTSHIPILIFTAYDWEDIKEDAHGVGIKNFMPKPFFMTNFKEAIRRVMNAPKLSAAVASDNVFDGKHVLIVDDIQVNRMILEKILKTRGATCDTAENGKEALDKFTAAPAGTYDIIIMDIQMPIMDGYTAAREIRKSGHPSAQSVAIVAMTANAFVDDVREALKAGMDAHIAKPIVLDTMMNTVRTVFETKALQAQ